MKLNGVFINLEAHSEPQTGVTRFVAPGTTISFRPLGDEADWRADSELAFELERGLTVGYHGFHGCEPG